MISFAGEDSARFVKQFIEERYVRFIFYGALEELAANLCKLAYWSS